MMKKMAVNDMSSMGATRLVAVMLMLMLRALDVRAR